MIGYVETMKLMSLGLPDDVLKGAYVTGPYSLAALLIGADDAAMSTIVDPERLHELCDFAAQKVQEYTMQCLAAGAEVVCVLEPTAVMLGVEQFRQFSARYVQRIAECCRYSGAATVYHVCGNTMHLTEAMVEAGVNGLSLDSPDVGIDLAEAASRVPNDVVIIGNINPSAVLAHGTPGLVIQKVSELLDLMEPYPNFVLSSGCDLPQETPLENIEAFMQIGRAYRRRRSFAVPA
jgi:uroporphyrinogen decarboxylase